MVWEMKLIDNVFSAPKRLSSSQIPSTSRAVDDEFVEKDDVVPVRI